MPKNTELFDYQVNKFDTYMKCLQIDNIIEKVIILFEKN